MSIPEKGKPDFTNLPTGKIKQYRDLMNDMIKAFSDFPDEKETLTMVWNCLSDECADRLGEDEIEKKPPIVSKAKLLRRSLKHSRFEKVK